MAEDFDDHRRIFDACPERVEGAAMIFKAPPQLGQCSTEIENRLSSRVQLMRGVSPLTSGVIGWRLGCLLYRTGNDFTAQLCVRREHAMEAD